MNASASLPALAGHGGGVGDLLSTLDGHTASRVLADLSRPPASGVPALPTQESRFKPSFKAPPARHEVIQSMASSSTGKFNTALRVHGGDFGTGPDVRLKPAVLNPWTLSRLNVPDRSFKKAVSGIKYHAQAEPIPDPTDEMCTRQHTEWLKKHAVSRDKEMHKVHHAREAINKAEAKLMDFRSRRARAVDIMSRDHLDMPEMGGKAKKNLKDVARLIKVTRKLNKAVGVDHLENEEKRLVAAVEECRKVDALRLRPPTPELRARHLKAWSGPDRPNQSRSFRETTPWREHDDNRALKARAASTGALMGRTM